MLCFLVSNLSGIYSFFHSFFVWEALSNPGVEEDISDVISCFLIFAEHVLHEVFALFTYSLPNWLLKGQLQCQDTVSNFFHRGPSKWHLAGEHLVQNDTEAPNINLEVASLF